MIAVVDSAHSESMWSLSCKHFWVTKDQHYWFPRALFCPFGSWRCWFEAKVAPCFHALETMCTKEKALTVHEQTCICVINLPYFSRIMFLLQFPLFDSQGVWLGCCIFWTHLVLCCLSVSAFTFVLPGNEGWCGCGLPSGTVGCCSMWAGEPGGMRPRTGWAGGQDPYPPAGPGGQRGQTQPWRAGQGHGDGDSQRPGWGVCPQVEEVGVAWHRHGWPQLRPAPRPSIRPELPGCWQAKGEAPLLTALFPHSSFHTTPGAQLAAGLALRPVSGPGLPWGRWGSEPEQRQPAGPGAAQLAAGRLGSWKSRCARLKFVAILGKSACFRRAGTEFKNWAEPSIWIERAASFGISLQEQFLNRGFFVKKTPWFPI